MSKRQDNGSRLPSPRSPAHLDGKILAHARANAPVKASHWRPMWGGGLATAAVLVVAVYLTQVTELEQADPVIDAVPAAKQAKMQAPAPSSVTREVASPREIDSYAEQFEADAAEEAPAMAAMADSPAGAARASPAELASDAAIDLDVALEKLRQLVDQGELEQAREEYAKLRQSCPGCDLPETLEEALSGQAGRDRGSHRRDLPKLRAGHRRPVGLRLGGERHFGGRLADSVSTQGGGQRLFAHRPPYGAYPCRA